MVFELELHIICNDQSTRDRVLAELPDVTDGRVDAGLFEKPQVLDNVDTGIPTVYGRIRYKNKTDIDNIRPILRGLNGMWAQCEAGSYIAGTNCTHDEENPVPCVQGDIFMEAK